MVAKASGMTSKDVSAIYRQTTSNTNKSLAVPSKVVE